MILLEGRVSSRRELGPGPGGHPRGSDLTNARGAPLNGALVKIPLLLPGGSQEFQMAFLRRVEMIQVGIAAP